MISNKSQKAVNVLKAIALELDKIKNVQQGNTWKASLLATLISYLGSDSTLIGRLNSLHFTKRVSNNYPGMISSTNVYDESKKDNFRNLIDGAINYIETHGIKEIESKGNLLHSFNNSQLIGGLFVAATLIFSAGNFVGKIEKDREIIESNNKLQITEEKYNTAVENNKIMQEENKDLKEEIISLKVKLKSN